MSDQEDDAIPTIEGIPTLVEAPSGVDSSSASEIGALFSEMSLTTTMSKVSVLEAFLASSTRDCNFSEFVQEILMSIMQVVKSEAGSIFESDPSNNSFFFRAVVGSSSDRVINFVIPAGQGIVGHVAESKMPIKVDNVPENGVHLKSIEKVVGFETRNLVALPILVRGKIYGVLELLNRVGEENFTSDDMELLGYLCKMAAKVIEIRLMIAWARLEQTSSGKKAA